MGTLRIVMMKPRCIFCYHKSGTILLKSVFEELCIRNDWVFEVRMGQQNELPEAADFILFGHSPVDMQKQLKSYSAVHVIRDPRDVIVSGYLYHLRTTEAWCIYKDFDLSSPIDFPNVPFSQRHRTEGWKKDYIRSLGGLSYQEKLQTLSLDDGIIFEMQHYGRWTIENMMNWDYSHGNTLEIGFEEIMGEYESTFEAIFRYLGLTEKQASEAMETAQRHNINRKTEKEISNLDHVCSKQTSKWREYLSPVHKKFFIDMFGDCLVRLGYESSNEW